MGQCSCCPLIFQRKLSTDSLSVDIHHPSLEVQLPDKLSKIDKKISKNQIKILKKQESIYFKHNNRLNIKNESISSKIVPMVHSQSRQFELSPTLDHSELYCKVKGKIKPSIQKISTMDEESSTQNQYFNNREDFSESNEESFIDGQLNDKGNKNDMTFTANQAVIMSHQFRTVKEKSKEGEDRTDNMEKMKQRVKQENLPAEELCQLYYQLGKYNCQEQKYTQSQQYLEKAYQLTKDVQSYTLKFDTISLLGYVLLIQEQFNEAIAYLLKAVRMQVNKQAGESMRLVELYYWLGESYLRLKKGNLAKEYLNKAKRGYNIYKIQDPQLHKMLYLQLGILYHNEEEFVEADRCYTRGIKIAEESKKANKYLDLLLKKAENYFAMESHKLCISSFAATFKAMRKYNLTESPLYEEAKTSLILSLKGIATACISQGQLASVIKSAEQCLHDIQQVKILKNRLKKMRAILYKES